MRRKKEEFSLEEKNITIEVHGKTLNGFASVCPRVSFEGAFGNEVLLESLSFPFERIIHFEQEKLSLVEFCVPSHLFISLASSKSCIHIFTFSPFFMMTIK